MEHLRAQASILVSVNYQEEKENNPKEDVIEQTLLDSSLK